MFLVMSVRLFTGVWVPMWPLPMVPLVRMGPQFFTKMGLLKPVHLVHLGPPTNMDCSCLFTCIPPLCTHTHTLCIYWQAGGWLSIERLSCCDCKKTALLLDSNWSVKRGVLRAEYAAFHIRIISLSSAESEHSAVKHTFCGMLWRIQLCVKWSERKMGSMQSYGAVFTQR